MMLGVYRTKVDQGRRSVSDVFVDANKPSLPLLVTGLGGVPGYNAFHYFRGLYGEQVIGVRQPNMWPLKGDGVRACDLGDLGAVRSLFDEFGFRSVLNTVGSCRLKSCELDPEMAHRVNVLGTENVAQVMKDRDCRLIHLSIDLVYAGREGGNYEECDHPDPVTVYGAKMVEAEGIVRAAVENSLVLRISLPMGISFNGHAGAIDWIASRFRQGKPATLYFDEVRTPTYTDCMNRLFHRLFGETLTGLYHAGGGRPLSLYEIAQVVNVVGGYDPNLLVGCPRIEAGPMPPRAGNVTLNSDRLRDAIGGVWEDPWPLIDEAVPESRDWHLHHRFDGAGEDLVHQLLYQNPSKPCAVPPNRNTLWGGTRFH